jgi:hypothetical protein
LTKKARPGTGLSCVDDQGIQASFASGQALASGNHGWLCGVRRTFSRRTMYTYFIPLRAERQAKAIDKLITMRYTSTAFVIAVDKGGAFD